MTLASTDAESKQPVCKFHQYGHCKLGSSCRHLHNDIICTSIDCVRKPCLARQPWPCKCLVNSGFCKFGNQCLFCHQISKSKNIEEEIEKLKISFQTVLKSLADKESKITIRQVQVKHLESMSKSQYYVRIVIKH